MSDQSFLYVPDAKATCSEAMYRFLVEYDDIIGLFFFVIKVATHVDFASQTAAKALDEVDGSVKPDSYYQRNHAFKTVQRYSSQLSRNLVTSMANNFLVYLSHIIQAVVRKRHEVLRSSEKVTTEEVLQFARIDDVISFIADRKVNELAYGSLRDMEAFLKDRLGVGLFGNDAERSLLTIFIELRNIQTHNRGIVNELFLKRLLPHPRSEFAFDLTKPAHVNFDQFALLSRNAIEVSLQLDSALSTKFRLKRFRFKARLAKDRASRARDDAV